MDPVELLRKRNNTFASRAQRARNMVARASGRIVIPRVTPPELLVREPLVRPVEHFPGGIRLPRTEQSAPKGFIKIKSHTHRGMAKDVLFRPPSSSSDSVASTSVRIRGRRGSSGGSGNGSKSARLPRSKAPTKKFSRPYARRKEKESAPVIEESTGVAMKGLFSGPYSRLRAGFQHTSIPQSTTKLGYSLFGRLPRESAAAKVRGKRQSLPVPATLIANANPPSLKQHRDKEIAASLAEVQTGYSAHFHPSSSISTSSSGRASSLPISSSRARAKTRAFGLRTAADKQQERIYKQNLADSPAAASLEGPTKTVGATKRATPLPSSAFFPLSPTSTKLVSRRGSHNFAPGTAHNASGMMDITSRKFALEYPESMIRAINEEKKSFSSNTTLYDLKLQNLMDAHSTFLSAKEGKQTHVAAMASELLSEVVSKNKNLLQNQELTLSCLLLFELVGDVLCKSDKHRHLRPTHQHLARTLEDLVFMDAEMSVLTRPSTVADEKGRRGSTLSRASTPLPFAGNNSDGTHRRHPCFIASQELYTLNSAVIRQIVDTCVQLEERETVEATLKMELSELQEVDARLSEDLSIYMNTDNRVQDALQMLGDHATHVAGELDRMDTENTRKRYDLLMDQENLKTEPPSQLKVSKASATHASSGLEAHPRLHLTFGGSFAEEVSRDMLQYEDLYEEIARATQLLQSQDDTNVMMKKRVDHVHKQRDVLLTRIEVLEQAVNMIHATVDMTEKDGEVKSRNHTNDSAVNFIVAPTALQLTGGQEWDDLRVGMGGLDKRTPKQPDPPEGGDIMWGWTSITKALADHVIQNKEEMTRGPASLLIHNGQLPRLLHFDGWVFNTHMPKSMVELRIKEIWSLKSLGDQKASSMGERTWTLPEFFLKYLDSRYGSPGFHDWHLRPTDQRTEFVYNFLLSLSQHTHDGDFMLFSQILYGDIHERHHFDQMMMISHFKAALSIWETKYVLEEPTGTVVRRTGYIENDVFESGLRSFFPVKSEKNMRELNAIAQRDLLGGEIKQYHTDVDKQHYLIMSGEQEAKESEGGQGKEGESASKVDTHDQLDILRLIAEDAEGNQSDFLECVRSQYLEEINEYLFDLRACMYKMAEERHVRQMEKEGLVSEEVVIGGTLTKTDVEAAFKTADPNITEDMVEDYVERGSRERGMRPDTLVDIEIFLANLTKYGPLNRMGHWRKQVE